MKIPGVNPKISFKILKILFQNQNFKVSLAGHLETYSLLKRQQAKVSVPLKVTSLNFHIKSKKNYNPQLFKITIHNFLIVLERSVIIII